MDRIYKRYTEQLKEGEDWKKPLSDDEVLELIEHFGVERQQKSGFAYEDDRFNELILKALNHYLQIKDS